MKKLRKKVTFNDHHVRQVFSILKEDPLKYQKSYGNVDSFPDEY